MEAYIGEVIGTMILILLGDGVVANVVLNNTKGNNSGWIVITTGWGLAVMMAVSPLRADPDVIWDRAAYWDGRYPSAWAGSGESWRTRGTARRTNHVRSRLTARIPRLMTSPPGALFTACTRPPSACCCRRSGFRGSSGTESGPCRPDGSHWSGWRPR